MAAKIHTHNTDVRLEKSDSKKIGIPDLSHMYSKAPKAGAAALAEGHAFESVAWAYKRAYNRISIVCIFVFNQYTIYKCTNVLLFQNVNELKCVNNSVFLTCRIILLRFSKSMICTEFFFKNQGILNVISATEKLF